MNIFEAIIIGLVQGLTEFLPISSSGHLVVIQKILKINSPGNLIEVSAHLGTLLSIILIYKKEICGIITSLKSSESKKYIFMIVLATLPSVVFVLSKMDFSDNQIKESFRLIEKTIDVKKRVSYDVYDYDRALIVIHDYTNRDDAENDIFKIKQELEGFQLKNNFVSLSSQYKNMLIYKTLELE